MIEIGTAKMLGDSWFLVSANGRYEIPMNDAWRLSPIDGQHYRFTASTDGWALGKSIELVEVAALNLEIGKIYRLRDLDNNAVWDARCLYDISTFSGDYTAWTLQAENGLLHSVSSDDRVQIEGEYDNWPEQFDQYWVEERNIFVDGVGK
jgi:hypothetical protein